MPLNRALLWACGSAAPGEGVAVRVAQCSGHSVPSTSTGALPGLRLRRPFRKNTYKPPLWLSSTSIRPPLEIGLVWTLPNSDGGCTEVTRPEQESLYRPFRE